MQVRDALAARPVVTVKDTDTLERASRLMLENGCRHLPVLSEGELVGVLSDQDVVAFHGYGGLRAPVARAMTREPLTARPEEPLADVARAMAQRKVGCLPILEGRALVGILTTTDLLMRHVDPPAPRKAPGPLEGSIQPLMTHEPATVHPDDRLLDAVGRMTNLGVRHLPVVDGDNRPLGMLSDRDVRRTLGSVAATEGDIAVPRRVVDYRVADVGTFPAMTLEEGASIRAAVQRFVDDRVGALAIVGKDGRISGVLSYVDVLESLAGVMHAPTVAVSPTGPTMPVVTSRVSAPLP
jgi:CBS domain-containing protein